MFTTRDAAMAARVKVKDSTLKVKVKDITSWPRVPQGQSHGLGDSQLCLRLIIIFEHVLVSAASSGVKSRQFIVGVLQILADVLGSRSIRRSALQVIFGLIFVLQF